MGAGYKVAENRQKALKFLYRGGSQIQPMKKTVKGDKEETIQGAFVNSLLAVYLLTLL